MTPELQFPREPLPVVRPMVRRTDPATSAAAADAIRPALNGLQRRVLDVFKREGPMTARYAESLEDFEEYGFSTIRKRISELAKAGYLAAAGTANDGRTPATIYAPAEDVQP